MISVIVSAAASGSFEIITDLQEQTHQDFEVLVAGPSWPCPVSVAGQGIEVLQDPIPQASKTLALNAALGRARGEYILTVESDDRMHPRALELLSAAAERAGDPTAMIIPGFEVMGSIGPAGRPGWTYTPSETADQLDMILRATPGPLFLRSERVRNAGGWPADYPSEGNLYPNLALLMKLLVTDGSISLPETVFRLRREKVTSSAEALAWWPIYKFLVARAAKAIGRLSEVCFDNQYERATLAGSGKSTSGASKPLVTAAMAVYNAEPYVRVALESALNQPYPHTEVIVVDDGSSDRTAAIVRSYETDRVRLIERTRNSGKGACMNVALDYARGDYLFELDGDDWLDPDATEVYVEAMLKASPDVACVHGRRRAFFSSGPGDLRFETVFPGRPIKDRYDFCRRPEALGPRFYRTAWLRAAGGWPADYTSGGTLYEDLALLFRLADRYRFEYVDQSLYNIRLRPDSVTSRHRQECWPILKELACQALARWGNEYVPEFEDETCSIRLRKAEQPARSRRSR